MEIKWGLIPDMGITRFLPRLVRADVAKELVFTGRIVDGAQAAEVGLVTRTAAEPLVAARELAAEIAGKSPDAIRRGKRLLDETWNAGAGEALLLESVLQTELLGTPNQIAAVTAGFTKEPAQFTDPG
jgi:enoyl-CoA hydratase/carnithine racemase